MALFIIAVAAIWTAVPVRVFAEEKASAPTAAAAAGSDGAGRIALAGALALVLRDNPGLAAFSWDIRAAEARKIQAGLRPNPELSLQAQSVVLSQLIELGGKRAKRMQLAVRDKEVSTWDYEMARADVLKNTAQAFVAVVAAQERVALHDELLQLAQNVVDTVSARVDAGRVSPLEAIKAKTALSTARVQVNASRSVLEAARTTLAALWGDKEARFERAEGSLEDDIRPVPSLDKVKERVVKNPDLSRWTAEVEKRRSAIALEKAKAKPDIAVNAGMLGSDGISLSGRESNRWQNSLILGVSISLPLFNRNQGAILEAEHLAAKAERQQQNADLDVNVRIKTVYESISTAYATLSSLKDDILPAATSTFGAINQAYTQGKFGYLDVLDAQRTLFEARQQYLDALASYHENIAEIERTIGESLWNTDLAKPLSNEEKWR